MYPQDYFKKSDNIEMAEPSMPAMAPHSTSFSGDSIEISPFSQHQRQSSVSSSGSSTATNSPIFLKTMTAPVLPTFKPQEARFKKPQGSAIITAVELGKVLDSTTDENLLILDVRPYIDYSTAHIKNAIHVCLPSTLLRRRNFTLTKLIANLTIQDQTTIKEKLSRLGTSLRVIIYDNIANQKNDSLSLACFGISSKILDYQKDQKLKPGKNLVSILGSGFNQFHILFPQHAYISTPLSGDALPPQENNDVNLRLKVPHTRYHSPSSSDSPTRYPSSFSESPVSASSPISALLKFSLPSAQQSSVPAFKFSKTEEIMNLESYLSAVNINEEYSKSLEEDNDEDESYSLQSFEFPKKTKHSTKDETPTKPSKHKKLRFQRKYDKILRQFPKYDIDQVIPQWFQTLMERPKIEFISKYQRLDCLERKRLNNCLTHKTSHSVHANFRSPYKAAKEKMNLIEEVSHTDSLSTPSASMHQKRLLSEPDCIGSVKRDYWKSMYLDDSDEDEDDSSISISSGVELGTKNRYKDIFPYEHSRVILRKQSLSSISSAEGAKRTDDISESYINANYLTIPRMDIQDYNTTNIGNFSHIRSASRELRYVATQAPLLSTVRDFYTCILNDNIALILSLTDRYEDGIEKCFGFWRDGDYDGIKVKLLEETTIRTKWEDTSKGCSTPGENNIFLRRIRLTYSVKDKIHTYETLQLQIKNWPDLGTLLDSTEIIQVIDLKNTVINELFKKNVYGANDTPTILVHCSAGCGRTGTWCTIDSILSHLEDFELIRSQTPQSLLYKKQKYDPIVWTINMFRRQRISMVQNINQFLFVYDCLLHYFLLRLRDVSSSKIDCNKCGMSFLSSQLQNLDIIKRFLEHKESEVAPPLV